MSENELEVIKEKRRPGRPKTGFDRKAYAKEYRKENDNKEYMKEYMKERSKKILEEKGEAYDNVKQKITEYSTRCREAYKILRELSTEKEIVIPEKYVEKINTLFKNK